MESVNPPSAGTPGDTNELGIPEGKPAIRSAYTWVLVGLVATTLLIPFAHRGGPSAVLIQVMTVGVIGAGVRAVGVRRRYRAIAIALAVPAIALTAVSMMGLGERTEGVRHAVQTLFFGYTAWIILLYVLGHGRVTGEKIRGAICVLLLMGATWAFAYLTLLQVDPGAISFPESIRASEPASDVGWIGDMLYFSFVNLTSVGYGDILPVSPLARTMAWIEALTGQLYMTLLIARLVSLHVAHNPPKQ
jgi:hypothetical protein